jgi:hypothetical protein
VNPVANSVRKNSNLTSFDRVWRLFDPAPARLIITIVLDSYRSERGYPTKDAAFPASPFYISAIAPDFKPGYVQQWTLSLQHAFTSSDSVEIAYIGSQR